MNRSEFWQLIDDLIIKTSGDLDLFEERLDDHLSSRSGEEILDFATHFAQLLADTCTSDIHGAALIIGCGNSEDGFLDFRRWIVLQGRSSFEQIMRDPDWLGDYAPQSDPIDHWYSEYDPMFVYEKVTGAILPDLPFEVFPSGGPEYQSDGELAQRFPKLWRRLRGDTA